MVDIAEVTAIIPCDVGNHTDWAPYIALVGVLVGLLFRWWADLQNHKRELKKAIYTELIRSLNKAVKSLATAVDPQRSIRDVSKKFAQGLEPLASAHVVARLPLSKSLIALHSALLRLSQTMHFERTKLDPLHETYLFLQSRFKMVADDLDKIMAELNARKVSHPEDAGHLSRLQQLFNEKLGERERIRAAMKLQGQQAAKQVASCCAALAEGMRGYPTLITDVIGEIRHELRFRFDRHRFLALQEQSNRFAQELMATSITEVLRRNGLEPDAG